MLGEVLGQQWRAQARGEESGGIVKTLWIGVSGGLSVASWYFGSLISKVLGPAYRVDIAQIMTVPPMGVEPIQSGF